MATKKCFPHVRTAVQSFSRKFSIATAFTIILPAAMFFFIFNFFASSQGISRSFFVLSFGSREVKTKLSVEDLLQSNVQLADELAILRAELAENEGALRSRLAALIENSRERNEQMKAIFEAGEGQVFGTMVKKHVSECLALEQAVRSSHRAESEARQAWVTAVHDARWRTAVREDIEWLHAQDLDESRLADANSVSSYLESMDSSAKKQHFIQALHSYLPNRHWWNLSPKNDTSKVKSLEESAINGELRLAEAKRAVAASSASLEDQLWSQCRLRIKFPPLATTQPLQSLPRHSPAAHNSIRNEPRLVTPEASWKYSPHLYPGPAVNVSFMVQYFRHPAMIATIVNNLYSCTEGLLGRGQLGSSLTSELLVNVDDGDSFREWHNEWKKTRNGSFLVPIFSHNIHENRGYNNLVNMARGRIVFLLQDDDIPPTNCTWLTRVLMIYDSWPKVAVVGLKRGQLHGKMRVSRDSLVNPLMDPISGVRMYFASLVDVGPMAFLRDLWIEMGGYDESYCKEGESCIFADFQLVTRVWLAGYQAVHMYTGGGLEWYQGSVGGTHKVGRGKSWRQTNFIVNLHSFHLTYFSEVQYVVEEASRLNSALKHVPMMD